MLLRNFRSGEKAASLYHSTSAGSSSVAPSSYHTPVVPRRADFNGIHWKVPTVLVSSFVIGVLGAIAHHGFYTAMHEKVVQNDSLQRIVLTSGNAMAFLVKISLAVSTATAFTQCLWFSLRRDCVTIQRMDSMFGVLGNPWEFCHLRFWLGHPVLALTAITTWLLPLSAIFTPSTISVRPKVHESIEAIQVLQRDSNVPVNNQFPVLDTSLAGTGSWIYGGDSPLISSLGNLNLVTADTVKVPLSAKNRNISYSTAFSGPAFQCLEANDTVTSYVLPAVIDYQDLTNDTLFWASWLPTPTFGPGMDGSFFVNVTLIGANTSGPGFEYPNDGPKIYHVKYFPTDAAKQPDGSIDANGIYRVIECTLYNATYDVQFDLHSNGNQVSTTNRTLLHVLPLAEVLPNTTFSEDQAIEIFNDVAFAQMYALYVAEGLIDSAGAAAFLVNSPTLGKAVALRDPFFMDFDEFTFALEQLFENVTLSWRFGQLEGAVSMPVPDFSSSPTKNATVRLSVNAFDYDPQIVFVSYGVAIGLTGICLICGVFAIYGNRASFSNNFSTILRTTRDQAFDKCFDGDDCGGADPLPEHTKDILVQYVHRMRTSASAKMDNGQGLKIVGTV